MKCRCCNRKPNEIMEYIYNPEGMEPEDFVRENEGSYEEKTDSFLCTICYIAEYRKGNVR